MVQGCAALAGAVIAASARPRKFPPRDFPITRFGAKGDGSSDGGKPMEAGETASGGPGGGEGEGAAESREL